MPRRFNLRVLISGACLSLAALAGTAAADGGGVECFNMELVSNVDVHTGVNDCWGYTSGGVELAIYGHETGTAFVDATDPANPVEVFNLPGPSSVWRDMKTYQNYAYIVTEGPGAGAGIQIVDLSDPLNPVHVTTYTGGGYTTAHNIWIDEPAGVAYACGAVNGGMHVLSLANPTAPVELSFFSQYYIHDLYVGNGRGYAGAFSSGSLRIMNTSNPSNVTTLASKFYSGAATHNAWPNTSGTHCFSSDEVGGGPMRSWDLTNLSSITQVAVYQPTNEASSIIHNVLVKDDMAHISYYKAGARVVDVTDPANPVEVGYYDTHPNAGALFNGCWGVYPFRDDDIVYASDRQSGLYILRFTGGYAGDVSGVVTESGSGTPISGATLEFVGNNLDFASGAGGAYSGALSGGTYTVITSLFGYQSDTTVVVVPEQGSVVHDVSLVQLSSGTVDITVLDARSGNPLPGAVVDILGTPFSGLVTDGSGVATVSALPAGPAWTVEVARFGSAVTQVVVTASAGLTTGATVELAPGFTDDFERNQGWISGDAGDTATDGLWERAVPVGSSYLGPVGVDQDVTATGAGFAWVTENHVAGAFVGTSDVDGGRTSLLTPVFDATGFGSLTLNYQRWFSNRAPSPGSDEFRVDVSTNGGASWTNLETINVGTDAWSVVSLDLTAAVPATAAMQLRFVAEDLGGDNYVEAGLDDVEIVTSATDAGFLVGDPPAPRLALAAPAPNPFRESTTLRFDVPSSGPVDVAVYDISGRRVARLLQGDRLGAGTHRVQWSGMDDAGRRVAPGVYFARLQTAEGELSRRIVRLR